MKFIATYFLVLIIGFTMILGAQNAPVATLGTIHSTASTVIVPITAVNFTNIASCDLKILYNPAVATATAVSIGPGMGGTISVNTGVPGEIRFGWFTGMGVTLNNGSAIFNITFNKVGLGTSNLSFDDDNFGFGCSYSTGSFQDLNDLPGNTYYIPGSLSFISDNESPVTIAPTLTASVGANINIPITVTGLDNIGAVSLILNYDPLVLSFNSATNTGGFPGLQITNPIPGTIVVGGNTSNPAGFSLANGSDLFMMNFTYLGGTTALSWFDNGESCEYAGRYPVFNVLNDSPQAAYYMNGSVGSGALIEASANNNGPLCVGQNLILTGGPNGMDSYAWSGPNSFTSSLQSPIINSITAVGAGNYTLTVTSNSGADQATTNVVVNTPPTAGITNHTGTSILTCSTSAINVTATGGASYAWSGGATPTTAANSFSSPGTYTVTVRTANGCEATANITITRDATQPAAGITNHTGTTILTCSTNAINVTATGGASYAWSGGATPTTAANSFSLPGTYTVTVTSANGCQATANITITRDATLPLVGITNNTATTILTCATPTISVTATGGSTYSWSNGTSEVGSLANLSITAPGTYTVTVTSANGCQATASITITRDATLPLAGITNNTATTILTCTTPTISVTATGGSTYSWSNGTSEVGTSANLSITAPGTYTVTVTSANGCQATASITITRDTTLPTASITNNTATTVLTCATPTISVTATGGSTYSWSNGTSEVGTSANLSITAPGTYTVTVTSANGCQATANITITRDATLPLASITNNTATTVLTCATPTISVTATGGSTYSWSDGMNVVGSSADLSITTPGTYTVTVRAANGCQATANITIIRDATLPTAGITNNTAATVLTCTTPTISVTATGGSTYSWSNGTSEVGSLANLSITAPGTYTVTVTSANGCQATASITITRDATLPLAGITNNTATTILTCTTPTISVTATGGSTYSWSNGTSEVGTSANLSITAPGTYTVTVMSANGCQATANIIITRDATLPLAGITNNTATTVLTCTTPTISVTATGGSTYSWSNGTTEVGTSANLSITAPGTYTVTVIAANGCQATASIIITRDATLPLAGITNNTATTVLTCTTPTISVTATGGSTYSWSNGTTEVGSSADLSITTPGTYTVTVRAANGCQATANITIIRDATLPVAGITNNTATTVLTCATPTTSVTATGGSTYSWSNGTSEVGSLANLSITTPGTYTVTVRAANGCQATANITIIRDATLPVAGITNNTATTVLTCATPTISVTATGGSTYSWSNGTNVVGTSANLSITAPGTYTVTVTSANGCQATASITITRDATLPVAGITNNTATTVLTCATPTISVTATGGSTYSWSNGTNVVGSSANLSITAPGTYTVTVMSANGCQATAGITITRDATLPVAGITNNTATTILTCTTPTISVTATGVSTYLWSNGTSEVGTSANLSITAPGTYTVTVTSANGCQATASIIITRDEALPVASITNNTATTVLTCTTPTISVTATGGSTYSWSNGTNVVGTSANLSITAPGTYTVTVTSANGCQATASITITRDATLPVAGITNNTATTVLTCATPTISVTATGGSTYSWSNGTNVVGTSANLSITAPGTYTVTVTSANGCQATASITITRDATLPVAGITNNTATTVLTCATPTISVTATGGSTYSWSNGTNVVGSSANLSITAPGTYTVTVMSANGCQATASITITRDATLPLAGITNNTATTVLTCATPTISVTATGGSTYSWSNGTTEVGSSANLSITAPGTYTVTVIAANGCQATANITITRDTTLPTASITNNTATTVLTCTTPTISVTVTGGSTYSWSNGTNEVGTSADLSITAPGTYTVTVTSVNGCHATAGITITMSPTSNLPVSVSIVASENPVNPGTEVSFTASPTNGGTNPVYQWKVNGENEGTNNPVLSYVPQSGDIITCTLTSSESCVSNNLAISNEVTVILIPQGTKELSYRFANPRIINGSGSNSFEFDIQVKASEAGTFLWSGQLNLSLDNTTLSTDVSQWVITKVGSFNGNNSLGDAKYNIETSMNGVSPSQMLSIGYSGDANAMNRLATSSDFVEVTTTYQTIASIRGRILSSTGMAGIDFIESRMSGQQFYKLSAAPWVAGYANPNGYDPADFMDTYVERVFCAQQLWTQVGGLNWANVVNTSVWDGDAAIPNGSLSKASALRIHDPASLTIPVKASLTVTGDTEIKTANGLTIQSDVSGTGSLITATASGAGSATAQRYMTTNAWHIVSSPLSGQSISNCLTTNAQIATSEDDAERGMMDYNPALNEWNDYFTNATPGNLETGKGFCMRTNANSAVTFTGLLQAGNQSASGLSSENWNCIGNPYPSAIGINIGSSSTDKFLVENAHSLDPLYGAVYVYDQPDGSNGTPGMYTVISNASPAFSVQQGQAYLVKLNSGVSSIHYNHDMQIHQPTLKLKSTKGFWPTIKLIASANSLQVSTIIAFNNGMTKGLDPTYDAGLFEKAADLMVYSRLVEDKGIPFAIQALPSNEYSRLVIPIGLKSKIGGEVVFSSEIINLPSDCKVILEDKLSKTYTDLSKKVYIATIASNVNISDRFYLHTSYQTTGLTTDPLISNLSAYAIRNVELIINGDVSDQAVASLYDVLGRLVLTRRLEGDSINSIKLPNIRTGVYILYVRDNGKEYGFKVTVKE